MKMNKKMMTLAGVALTAMSLAACGNSGKNKASGDLNVTLKANPVTLDPAKTIETPSTSMQVQSFEGLLKFDKNNNVVLGEAATQPKVTNDGKTWTFTLKKGLKWSNGDEVTAQDYVASMRHWADPKTKSQAADKVANLANYDQVAKGSMPTSSLGVKALGKYKVQFDLAKKEPTVNVRNNFAANLKPVNHRVLAKEGNKYGSSSSKAVYNGPFKVANWTGGSDDEWSYVKNERYYNQKQVNMKKVNVQVTKDNNTAQNLFKSGKVQETAVTADYVKGNKGNKELHTSLMATQYYLYFNGKNELTKNGNFRQAVNYAFDNNQLAKKVLQDGSVGATGWVPKGDMKNPKTGEDFAKQAGDLQKQNKQKAQNYWKAAQKDLGKKKLTLNLLADNTDDQKQVAEYLQSTLQKQFKGLKVEVTTLPHAQHVSRDFAGKFELNLTDWNSNVPDASDFLSLLKTGNKVNFTNNTDQKLDNLLNEANDGTKSAHERYQLLQEANKQVHTNADGVPLYTAAQAHLVSKHVTGLNYGPFNTVAQYQYAQWKK
ncbi:peptide ABC transporter substrate-binding protein [uncultured Limosilactobacillus sp.]|uniref:peptide ABC transporter substrate-binding protein n=1 Tax=uncultured Limosilactobacillus sp. TaxID=2837629 RepID=UPI0025FAA33A|nr:peptide ABC transporter substrate-binding protein [uncultured Limosilactobacillus sp.]